MGRHFTSSELESTVGNMETPTENESTFFVRDAAVSQNNSLVWFSLTISSNWFCVNKLLHQLSGLAVY